MGCGGKSMHYIPPKLLPGILSSLYAPKSVVPIKRLTQFSKSEND